MTNLKKIAADILYDDSIRVSFAQNSDIIIYVWNDCADRTARYEIIHGLVRNYSYKNHLDLTMQQIRTVTTYIVNNEI